MRASVFIATSLDGFIARPDGAIDWLPADGGEPHGYREFWASVDAVVIGRRTFETVLGFGDWGYGTKPVFVLSSRHAELSTPAGAACEFMAGTPRQITRRLERRGFEHLWIDGGVTIQGFLRAGLIQRMTITRLPVLLGAGVPLFGPLAHDVRLEHVATCSFPSGLVSSEYRVLH